MKNNVENSLQQIFVTYIQRVQVRSTEISRNRRQIFSFQMIHLRAAIGTYLSSGKSPTFHRIGSKDPQSAGVQLTTQGNTRRVVRKGFVKVAKKPIEWIIMSWHTNWKPTGFIILFMPYNSLIIYKSIIVS